MATDRPLFGVPTLTANGVFFWLLRTPVAIRYSFFLVAVVMAGRQPVAQLPGWLVVVTLAVLLHELGHAAAARLYGQDPAIELHAMGGATRWRWRGSPRWHQRALVALAGPAIGFVAAACVYAGTRLSGAGEGLPDLLAVAIGDFLWVTIAWGVFNLLPILPLDGGGIMEAVLGARLDPARAQRLARILSCACAALCAALAIFLGQPYAALLCALFAWSNFQQLGAAQV